MTREQTIEKYVEKYNLTLEEATTLYEQDESGWENPELKDAKPRKRNYVRNATSKKKPRERKIDTIKLELFEKLQKTLCDEFGIEGSLKNETELKFKYLDNDYTLKLIKHRPPKK